MTSRFLNLAFTSSVKAAQTALGSRDAYSRHDQAQAADVLTPAEVAFVAARDSFYIASVGETGWPYLQHRGGPKGFLRVLDERTLGFADYCGNRQYVSLGNIGQDDRVALFLMDYPNRRRLKILGRMSTVDLSIDTALAGTLTDADYKARVERGFAITVEAFDWNCPQHIAPRYTLDDITPTLDALKNRIAALERQIKDMTP